MTTEQNQSPLLHISLDAQHYELIERCNALRDTNAELLDVLESSLVYANCLPSEVALKFKSAIAKARAPGAVISTRQSASTVRTGNARTIPTAPCVIALNNHGNPDWARREVNGQPAPSVRVGRVTSRLIHPALAGSHVESNHKHRS
jgi:hypothetical protein